MCFCLSAWLDNYDVLERLLDFLTVRDVVALASCSRGWRDVLSKEMVWGRVVKGGLTGGGQVHQTSATHHLLHQLLYWLPELQLAFRGLNRGTNVNFGQLGEVGGQ